MAPGYNNNANFRIEYNLNSIFSQNYTNYKVVIINDKSNDGSDEIYRKYFAFHRIDKERYTYI
jgi:glycosyltransferase involved in cell wall biosynthesis